MGLTSPKVSKHQRYDKQVRCKKTMIKVTSTSASKRNVLFGPHLVVIQCNAGIAVDFCRLELLVTQVELAQVCIPFFVRAGAVVFPQLDTHAGLPI